MNHHLSLTKHVPIPPEIQKAYDDFLLDLKEIKKEKWKKCRGQCLFETQEDGSHKCAFCNRKIKADCSPIYDIPKETDDDIIDEINLDQDIQIESDDIIPERDDTYDEAVEFE